MAGAQYRLIVRQGPIQGQIFELNKNEISVGRDISNDFVINDAEVSRKHAKLTLEGDRYKIEDLNSTNGTYIDGQRLIGPHVMAIGEIIMFGDNVGVIFDGEPAKPDVTLPGTIDLGSTPVAAIPVPEERSTPVPVLPTPEASNLPVLEESMPDISPKQEIESERRPINTWLLAGFGCVLVIVVVIVALLVFIDQPWNPGGGLYCVSPFDIIFKTLGYCP